MAFIVRGISILSLLVRPRLGTAIDPLGRTVYLGAFSVRNSFADVGMALGFGVLGYLMAKLGYPSAPRVLALILTPLLESALRQSLGMAHGNPAIFFTRPIALVLIGAGVALTAWTLVSRHGR